MSVVQVSYWLRIGWLRKDFLFPFLFSPSSEGEGRRCGRFSLCL